MARQKRDNEEKAFRIYVTDALKCAYSLNIRYLDVVEPQRVVKDDRTAEEIIGSIVAKIEGINHECE